MLRRFNVIFLVILFGLFACEGEQGPVGPEGPAGPKGDQGLQGEQGPAGVANMTVETFAFSSSAITVSGNYGEYEESISSVTQEVVDNGLVLVYWGTSDESEWASMPLSYNLDYDDDLVVDEVIDINYSYKVGFVNIFYTTSDTQLLTGNLHTGPFKVVVIPPSGTAKLPAIDYSDHDAVMEFVNK